MDDNESKLIEAQLHDDYIRAFSECIARCRKEVSRYMRSGHTSRAHHWQRELFRFIRKRVERERKLGRLPQRRLL